MDRTLADALREGPVVLDGGLATELEQTGHDLSSRLWSARLLRDEPEALVRAHTRFLEAGAQVVTTASYQASVDGFGAAGLDREAAADLVGGSVSLARRAVAEHGRPAWVAASVGPYGAVLAGGQEYTGDYGDTTVAGLRAFHRPRLELLAAAGPDVLACETVPCLAEVEALLAEVDRLGVPAWLSLTTVTGADGVVRTRRGEPAAEAFAMARDVAPVVAVGVNCTAPDGVADAVALAARVWGGAVVAYPNSGDGWDAAARAWTGAATTGFDPSAWVEAGARLVGGCCRVGPEDIARVARSVGGHLDWS